MTSLLQGLIYGVVVLSYVSAIEFRGYKLFDPTNATTGAVKVQFILPEEEETGEYQIHLPQESGKPKAFQAVVEGVESSAKVRIVPNHTKGTAHGVHLVYAEFGKNVVKVFDAAEGQSTGSPIQCVESDIISQKQDKTRCIAITSGWMSMGGPRKLVAFQHVAHSKLHAFVVNRGTYIFYILRENNASALQIDYIDKKDASVTIWYSDNVMYDKTKPLTLDFLTSKSTKYGENFAIIGEFKSAVKTDGDGIPKNSGTSQMMKVLKEFLLVKRPEGADESKCMTESVILGTKIITFRDLAGAIILERNMDEVPIYNEDCFAIISYNRVIQKLNGAILETPDHPVDDQIIFYEARASPSKPFYAVALTYNPEFDHNLHKHHFALVNNIVFHLEDLRYAGDVVYQLDESVGVVQLFRSTPAIKLKILPYSYAFKVLPYWMDQCMPHMEHVPLHNYYEAISHSGPDFERDNIWADTIITKTQCVNTSLLNNSLASFVELVEHHTERRLINNTQQTLERDMSQTYEEYDDIHVDQRNPCNDINVLSKIKRTIKNVSKKDNIVLEAKDDEPLRVTLNLEEGETFFVRFFNVERAESKCQDLDTVAIFLKDDMLVNQKAYIRTLTHEALTKRKKTWTGTGKLTIAIPNGCFRVEIVSLFSIQRSKYLRNIRACLVVMALTTIWSGTAILLYYKFSLAGREYRRLRRMYKRAKRHDHFVRHYLEWKENVEEIIAAWEKVPDDH